MMDDQAQTLATLNRWADWWAQLGPDAIDGIDLLAAEDLEFRDPFNHVHGREALARIIRHMYRSIPDTRFEVIDVALSSRIPGAGIMHWHCTGQMAAWPGLRLDFPGMSHIVLTDDRQAVAKHHDYWDSGKHFHARLPLLGGLIRAIARRAAG